MKTLVTISCLLLAPLLTQAQSKAPLDLEPYFTAIIVSDMDASIDWYTDVLGFEVENKFESDERGFKQSNLSKAKIALELIEMDRALDPTEAIPNYDSKTRLLGFFKTGFRVSNFDNWMVHLESQQVNFYGDVVADDKGKKMIIITDPDGNRIQFFEK